MKNVLLLCPYFPPSASVAAKRSLRFVRHLRKFGWEPHVLTVSGSAGGGYDKEQESFLPKNLFISRDYAGPVWELWKKWEDFKAKARGRGENAKRTGAKRLKLLDALGDITYDITPVDQFLMYANHATQKAIQLISQNKIDVIYASAYPLSALLVATWAGEKTNIPVVLDLRDPWSLDPLHYAKKPFLLRSLEGYLEKSCFQRASCIIVNTKNAHTAYQSLYPEFATKIFYIRNGYDAGLFTSQKRVTYPKTTLVHFGNFFRHRTIEPLLSAFAQKKKSLRFVSYGAIRKEDLTTAESLGVLEQLEARQSVPYAETLSVLSGADILLLIQSDETDVQIPAKLYDYLCAKRPILSLSTNTEIKEILEETQTGIAISEPNADNIITAIDQLMVKTISDTRNREIEAYSAESQTQILANHFSRIVR